MTDKRIYRLTIELPLSGSVREERAQIEKLPGLAALETAVCELGGSFKDSIVRVTGERVLKHPAAKKVG